MNSKGAMGGVLQRLSCFLCTKIKIFHVAAFFFSVTTFAYDASRNSLSNAMCRAMTY